MGPGLGWPHHVPPPERHTCDFGIGATRYDISHPCSRGNTIHVYAHIIHIHIYILLCVCSHLQMQYVAYFERLSNSFQSPTFFFEFLHSHSTLDATSREPGFHPRQVSPISSNAHSPTIASAPYGFNCRKVENLKWIQFYWMDDEMVYRCSFFLENNRWHYCIM